MPTRPHSPDTGHRCQGTSHQAKPPWAQLAQGSHSWPFALVNAGCHLLGHCLLPVLITSSSLQEAQTLSIWLIYKEKPLGSMRKLFWRCYACSLERWSGTSTTKPLLAALPHKYDLRCHFCEPHLQRVEQTTNNNAQHHDLHRDRGTLSSSHIYSSGQWQAHTAGSGRSTAQARRQPRVSQPGSYAPSSNSGELHILWELTREHQALGQTPSEGSHTTHTSIPTPAGWS